MTIKGVSCMPGHIYLLLFGAMKELDFPMTIREGSLQNGTTWKVGFPGKPRCSTNTEMTKALGS